MNPSHSSTYDKHSLANLGAYERNQLDPFYFQRAAQAAVRDASRQYADPDFRPLNFTQAAMKFEGDECTIRDAKRQELRQVRGGQMPANFWAPASTIRGFGLDPNGQTCDAPTRRRRWYNDAGGFVQPMPTLDATPGYRRVIKWQEYEQDKTHTSLGIQKQPILFGHPAYGYLRTPIDYRALTREEQLDPFAHTRFENLY